VIIGFISDVVGPVSMPLYSVVIYKSFLEECTENPIFLKGKQVCLVSKCLKTITNQLPQLMKKKGCDASNVYDEEQGSDPEYFSDDEQERAFKLKKKNKNKKKRNPEDIEEGEIIISDEEQEKKKSNKRKQQPSGYSYPNKKQYSYVPQYG
jgi:hypothetical protein